MIVDGVEVICSEEISEEVARAYIKEIHSRNPKVIISAVEIDFDGDYANIKFKYKRENFERIRRITGYLVGTIDRWNDGKKAEERDRVKHFVTDADVTVSGAERI